MPCCCASPGGLIFLNDGTFIYSSQKGLYHNPPGAGATTTIATPGGPGNQIGLGIDQAAGLLFWTGALTGDTANTDIISCALDGSGMVAITNAATLGVFFMNCMAVDAVNKKLYFIATDGTGTSYWWCNYDAAKAAAAQMLTAPGRVFANLAVAVDPANAVLFIGYIDNGAATGHLCATENGLIWRRIHEHLCTLCGVSCAAWGNHV